MAFRWRAHDGQTLNVSLVAFQGIRTSFAKKTCMFVFFQGGGSDPCPPSGSVHGDNENNLYFLPSTEATGKGPADLLLFMSKLYYC